MRLDLIVRNRLNSAKYAKSENELRTIFSDLVDSINTAMEKRHSDVLRQAKAAIKGIGSVSKEMNGDMVFICGQYAMLIHSMVESYRVIVHSDSVNEIMSSKTSQDIAKYLWKNGCSLREAVGCHIGMSRNSFDACMNSLIESGIVRHDIGPECEWVELSAEGYAYMRKHYFEKEGFNLW